MHVFAKIVLILYNMNINDNIIIQIFVRRSIPRLIRFTFFLTFEILSQSRQKNQNFQTTQHRGVNIERI